MEKQQPCCARWTSRLHTAKRDLAVVARKASSAQAKGRSIEGYKAQIAELKDLIERYKQSVEDHAAEHAGVVDTTSTSDREQMAAYSIQTGARA
jgi:uncharacterized membrane-anchored protein YhcB (DUF1043 family)